MTCPIPAQNLFARRQYRRYKGLSVAGTGGYPYVLAATVPYGQYWLVWQVSILGAKDFNAPSVAPELYLIQANAGKLPLLPAGNNPDDPFFLDYRNFTQRAFGPGAFGLRVDTGNLGSTGGNPFWLINTQGEEVALLKRPILVNQGETLMGWCQTAITPSNPSTSIEMRLQLAVMNQGDDIELEF